MTKLVGSILICCVLLTGCAVPETVLKDRNGDVATCGGGSIGSVAGGLIGYSIQKSNAEDCVNEYKKSGFTIIKHSDD